MCSGHAVPQNTVGRYIINFRRAVRGGEFLTLGCKTKPSFLGYVVFNIVSSLVSSPSRTSTKLFNLCRKEYDKFADYVTSFPARGTRLSDAICRKGY